MFKVTDGKGFHIEFENGITVSVQFGAGNYCQNYNSRETVLQTGGNMTSMDAEVAIWDKEGNWLAREYVKEVLEEKPMDTVLPRQTVSDVMKILAWAENFTPVSS